MEWISVKDRLPIEYQHVIVFAPEYLKATNIFIGYYRKDRGFACYNPDCGHCYDPSYDGYCENATHWMPLPEQPNET